MQIHLMDVNNKQHSRFKIYREHGTDDYLFVHFRSPAKVMIKGRYIDVGANDCILYGKKELQSYFSSYNNDFLHDFIHFDVENEYEINLINSIPTSTVINIIIPNISSTLLEIKKELYSHTQHKNDILFHLCIVFYTDSKMKLI